MTTTITFVALKRRHTALFIFLPFLLFHICLFFHESTFFLLVVRLFKKRERRILTISPQAEDMNTNAGIKQHQNQQKVVLNEDSVLAEIQRLGEGLIDAIEVR